MTRCPGRGAHRRRPRHGVGDGAGGAASASCRRPCAGPLRSCKEPRARPAAPLGPHGRTAAGPGPGRAQKALSSTAKPFGTPGRASAWQPRLWGSGAAVLPPTSLPGSAWAPGKGRAVRAWVGEGGLVGFAWTQGQGVLGEPTFGSRGNAGGCGPAAANPIGPHTSALRPHVDFCLKNIGKCSKCGNCGPNEAHVGGGSRRLARPGQVALDPASPIRGSSQGPGALKAAGPKAA